MDRIQALMTDWQNVSVSYSFAAATNWSSGNGQTQITGKTGWTIYIQKITLAVTTDNAAQQTFQGTGASALAPAAVSKASPGIGPITWDFGTEGFALPTGEGLAHDMSAAGMAGSVAIQAYMKRDAN